MISSEPNDVFSERAGVTFVLRVAGLALSGDRVLLHRSVLDDFWSLPGGRINIGETTESALIREMLEETDIEVGVSRLLWTAENFFEYRGVSFHELGLYYLMTLPPSTDFKAMACFRAPRQAGWSWSSVGSILASWPRRRSSRRSCGVSCRAFPIIPST